MDVNELKLELKSMIKEVEDVTLLMQEVMKAKTRLEEESDCLWGMIALILKKHGELEITDAEIVDMDFEGEIVSRVDLESNSTFYSYREKVK